nr:hydrogenase maturation nickel metallochaperone HypA [uncultured Enterobacter sp.]
MHELSLCQNALAIVLEQAAQHRARRVTGVWLEVGALACVEETALRFSFDAVCRHTQAQGCELHITHSAAQAWCWDCSASVTVMQHDAPCPLCQGVRLHMQSGDALRVKSIEVE